jgi:hypothetical protein
MKYSQMTQNQKDVFNAAKIQLKNEPWFRGVCADNFPNDKECKEHFLNAVDSVVYETVKWDGLP